MLNEYQKYLSKFADFLIQTKDGEIAIPYTECEWYFDSSTQLKTKDVNPPGLYENRLLDFMCRPVSSSEANQLVHIVVGGLGTGKSTTLARCYNRFMAVCVLCPRQSDQVCRRAKRLIVFDFEKWTEHLSLEELQNPSEYKDKLWNTIAGRIKNAVQLSLDIKEEVTSFWSWCCSEIEILEESNKVQRFFINIEPKLKALTEDKDYLGLDKHALYTQLATERERFMNDLDEYDSRALAIYCLLLLKYTLKKEGGLCTCTQLFVDNLDHVVPEGQVIVANFAQKIAGYLGVRTVIAVRPLTYERSIHAHFVDIRTYHKSPNVCQVISDRINAFIKYCDKKMPYQLKRDLENLRLLLSSKHVPRSAISVVLEAASGLSVRNALFYARDMLSSGIMMDKKTGTLALKSRKQSDLMRALFFGQQQDIDTKKFEILYSVNGDRRLSYALIKPRIMDFVIRIENGQTTVRRVFEFMACFWNTEEYDDSHGEDVVRLALNELMLRYRPLIWIQDGFFVDSGNETSNGLLTVTHIGRGYWDSLFGELLYEEVCLTSGADQRVILEDVVEFHKHFTDQDVTEIKCCKRKIGRLGYNRYYPREDNASLSLEHWRGLDRSLSIRLSENYDRIPGLDRKRGEWIKELSNGRQTEILNTIGDLFKN